MILTKLAIELKRYMNYDAVIGTQTVDNIIQTLIALIDYQEKYMIKIENLIFTKQFDKISKKEIK